MFLLFTLYILGSDAIPFMTASQFFIVYPKTDGVPVTPRFTGL